MRSKLHAAGPVPADDPGDPDDDPGGIPERTRDPQGKADAVRRDR